MRFFLWKWSAALVSAHGSFPATSITRTKLGWCRKQRMLGQKSTSLARARITFDTTNATVGGSHLIPVAVGRDIRQIAPVSGRFIGMSEDLQNMSADVFVTS